MSHSVQIFTKRACFLFANIVMVTERSMQSLRCYNASSATVFVNDCKDNNVTVWYCLNHYEIDEICSKMSIERPILIEEIHLKSLSYFLKSSSYSSPSSSSLQHGIGKMLPTAPLKILQPSLAGSTHTPVSYRFVLPVMFDQSGICLLYTSS